MNMSGLQEKWVSCIGTELISEASMGFFVFDIVQSSNISMKHVIQLIIYDDVVRSDQALPPSSFFRSKKQ